MNMKLAALLTAALLANSAHAQIPIPLGKLPDYQGTGAYLGVEGGGYRASNESASARLFAGYAFTPRLAWEFGVWSGGDFTETGDQMKAHSWNGPEISILWHPLAGGFFLRAGVNYLAAKTEFTADETPTRSDSGLGASFGFGYDLAFGRSQHHHLRFAYTTINNEAVNEEDVLGLFSIGYFYTF